MKSSGNISIEKQVQRGPALEWRSISEASSLVFEPEHWEALEIRVLEWFSARGVHAADPWELVEAAQDRYKRSLSLRSSCQISCKPTLKRVKMLASLCIKVDYEGAAAPLPRLTDSC